MRKIISILFSMFAFGGCSSNSSEPIPSSGGTIVSVTPSTPNPSNNNLPQRKFLALGDSYTIGQSVEEKDRWSVQLVDLLKNDFYFTKHDIIARTGWTTEELINAINSPKNTEQYDMVSLLIGVNNQYRGQSLDKYRTEFRALLNISVGFARNQPKRVFVLSIPDWGMSPFGKNSNSQKIGEEIDAFNNVAKDECQKLGIVFIDITEISRKNTTSDYFASDQLHYSGKMHLLWAKEALMTVKNILKSD
jgi:lysophospholipase L1-like esterase